jgi:hypothetical protein
MRLEEKNSLVSDCVSLLAQGLGLLQKLDDNLYVRTQGLHSRSGVGHHVRHCLDFINSFLVGLETGYVDYNQRARDEAVEHYPSVAVRRIEETIATLEALTVHDGEMPLLVSLEGSGDKREATAWCRSTVMRELQFLQSHLTHHYALMALMLRLQGFETDEEFGVTPSTLRYWRQQEACVR